MQLISPDNRLLPGFPDPVFDSQRVFRAVLKAMSCPGRSVACPVSIGAPRPLNATTTVLCLTLLDLDTPVWVQPESAWPKLLDYLRFHCGCPLEPRAAKAGFAIVTAPGAMPLLDGFSCGDTEAPEGGATIIIQVDDLVEGRGPKLAGPGIQTTTRIDAEALPAWFWPAFRENTRLFPAGVDVLLTTDEAMVALPRTLRVEL